MSNLTNLENHNNLLSDINSKITNIKADIQNLPNYLDTSDATATEEDVLANKTYYGKGIKRTGTMPNIGQQIVTPSTERQIITKGYHNGTGYVEAVTSNIDSNIVSGNIKNRCNNIKYSGYIKRYK